MTGRRLYCTPCITSLPDRTIARTTQRKENRCDAPGRNPRVALAAVADESRRGSGSGCRRRRARGGKRLVLPFSPISFLGLGFSFPSFVFLIPTLIYASRLVALIPLLYSRSLPHRLGRGSRILSRYEREREREGVRDTPSWVTGPRVGAGGGVVTMATVGVEAAWAAAQTRSRRPWGRQRH
jgi:hypothetical protein